MKKVLFYIVKQTIVDSEDKTIETLILSLFHLILSLYDKDEKTNFFDNLYIYNNEEYIPTNVLSGILDEYRIDRFGNITIKKYTNNSINHALHDIYTYCIEDKTLKDDDRALVLTSDIMVNVDILQYINLTELESNSIFYPNCIYSKKYTTNSEILNYTRESVINNTTTLDIRTLDNEDKIYDNNYKFILTNYNNYFYCCYTTLSILRNIIFSKEELDIETELDFNSISDKKYVKQLNNCFVVKKYSNNNYSSFSSKDISLYKYLSSGFSPDLMNKKICIFLTENTRTFENTISNLFEVIEKLQENNFIVDVILSSYLKKYDYHPYIETNVLKFNQPDSDYIDYNSTSDYFRLIYNLLKEKFDIIAKIMVNNNIEHEINKSMNILNQKMSVLHHGFLSNERLIDCIKLTEISGEKYDYIIRSNFENIITIPTISDIFPKNFSEDIKNTIYLDDKNIYPNDSIYIGNLNSIRKLAMSIKDEYINPTSEKTFECPPHGVIYTSLKINRFNVVVRDLTKIILWSRDFENKLRENNGKLICHRANLYGKTILENHPDKIYNCLRLGFDIEIDIRKIGDKLFLGHDNPQYEISLEFLEKYRERIWIHCKDYSSLEYMNNLENRDNFNYFYHTDEDYILTSKNNIWCYPGKKLLKNSVCVMPELDNSINKNELKTDNNIYKICTDNPYSYTENII